MNKSKISNTINNINETGKVFGIGIFHPKAVREAYAEWEVKHLHFLIIKLISMVLFSFGIVRFIFDGEDLLFDLSLLLFICVLIVINREYNKQAPEELKRRYI